MRKKISPSLRRFVSSSLKLRLFSSNHNFLRLLFEFIRDVCRIYFVSRNFDGFVRFTVNGLRPFEGKLQAADCAIVGEFYLIFAHLYRVCCISSNCYALISVCLSFSPELIRNINGFASAKVIITGRCDDLLMKSLTLKFPELI